MLRNGYDYSNCCVSILGSSNETRLDMSSMCDNNPAIHITVKTTTATHDKFWDKSRF